MTTLYDDLGPAIVGAFVTDPYFSVLGALPTCYRTTPGDPTQDATQASVGARAASIIPASGPHAAQALPAVAVWDTNWYVMAGAAVDIQADDVLTDGARAFVVTQQPITFFGFLLGPCEVCAVPEVVTTPGSMSLDFSQASNSGYVPLLGGVVVVGFTPSLDFSDARNSGYIGAV